MKKLITAETNLLAVIETLFAQPLTQNESGQNDPRLLALPTVAEHVRRLQLRLRPGSANPLANQAQGSPQQLPVCRHLTQTLADPAADAAFVTALRPLLPTLAWIQNPNYQQDNMPLGFLENYGYTDIVSVRGLIADPAFALGILLLGPHTEYPTHHHPAAEIYYTIGGAAQWWQTDQPWTHRAPNSLVYHASGVVHAMRTEAEPVCLLYAWWGDVQTAARLTKIEK